jgi:hypothetical protein
MVESSVIIHYWHHRVKLIASSLVDQRRLWWTTVDEALRKGEIDLISHLT